jgi:serine/threonine protein kinase
MHEWQLGSYQLISQLGEGGMAQVYLARDVRLGREVAVKVLDRRLAERPGFRERFQREARLAAALDHPNIVPLYDFGETNVLYLVMPYLSGGSMQDMLHRTPFEVSQVVTYGTQITDALEYAHQRNVVHRDVKPANILLHADGRLMLSDFGLAKILDGSGRPAAPRNHPDAGTPEYMAPEQIEGRTDSRADIYAVGVVLYLLLTGHLPFTGSTSNAVMDSHLYRLPDPPRRLNRRVTPALETVVLRALAKHPDDRYQTASELGAALLAALVAGDAEPLSFVSGPSQPTVSLPPATPPSPLYTPSIPVPRLSVPRATAAPQPPQTGRATEALPDLDLSLLEQWSPHPQASPPMQPPSHVLPSHVPSSRVSPGPHSPHVFSGVPFSVPALRNTAPPVLSMPRTSGAPAPRPSTQPPQAYQRVSSGPIPEPAPKMTTMAPMREKKPKAAPVEHSQRIWLLVVALLFILLIVAGLLLHWVETTPGLFGA